MLQEELEGLRQTQHRLSGDHEGGDFFAPVIDDLALVSGGVVGGGDGRRAVAERSVHELVHAGGELVVASGGRRGGGGGEVAVVAGRQEGRPVVAQHGGHGHHGRHGRGNEGRGTSSGRRGQVRSGETAEAARKS